MIFVWKSFCIHDYVIKWKHFPRYCPFVRGIHRSLVNSPHKGHWRGALMFSLVRACTNRVNNRDAGDLRRHRAHYDVNVMFSYICEFNSNYRKSTHTKYLFRHRSKKTSKLCVSGLCAGNSPVSGEFPAQMASNAENISIWWRRHENLIVWRCYHTQLYRATNSHIID